MKPLQPTRISRPRPGESGISLIELMVGVAIGLIVTLAVTSTVSIMNLQRRTTVSGNDAAESAQSALTMLERSARLAGAGLFYNSQLLCTTMVPLAGGAAVSLAPIKIVDGGATGSDTITVTYGNAAGGNSSVNLVGTMATTADNFIINHAGKLQTNDHGIVGVPGSTAACTQFKVASTPTTVATCNGITTSCSSVTRTANTTLRYGHLDSAVEPYGPAVISRLGTLTRDTYEVLCNSLVSHDTATAASCTASPLSFGAGTTPLVDDVVMIQAQYGVTASAASDVVTNWVSATGAWAAPSAADLPRIKAVRIAVVARSKEAATTNVSSACINTAAVPVANTGPCSFEDAEAPVIDLSATSVPAGRTWQNYRYRVYQSVIPLRNVSWNY